MSKRTHGMKRKGQWFVTLTVDGATVDTFQVHAVHEQQALEVARGLCLRGSVHREVQPELVDGEWAVRPLQEAMLSDPFFAAWRASQVVPVDEAIRRVMMNDQQREAHRGKGRRRFQRRFASA